MGKKNNNKKNQPKQSEDNAVILDYLSLGYINSDMSKFRGKPVAQAIGRDYFTLLELTPKEGIDLGIQDTVYNMIEWQYLFAASLLATIPVVILFMCIEKHLVSGLTSGGVKG